MSLSCRNYWRPGIIRGWEEHGARGGVSGGFAKTAGSGRANGAYFIGITFALYDRYMVIKSQHFWPYCIPRKEAAVARPPDLNTLFPG
jgi:hypothetical protein